MKSKISLLMMAILAISMLVAFPIFARANGQAGTTLSASVTATGYWTITYTWTIDKSVNPDTWYLSSGGSGTSQYTITVTKDKGTKEAWIEGEVYVTNGGNVATENLKIVVELYNGYTPPKDYLAKTEVDVSSHPVLDPGETHCYNYRVDIPITDGSYSQPKAGGTYKVTAKVTITNHSGYLGEPFGPSPSATTTFPSTPTLVNDEIHVDDTNGGSWAFSTNGYVTYERTFTCEDEGENINTATIRETGQSDSATVTVYYSPAEVYWIYGCKFHDADADGEYDSDESGLKDWIIGLYDKDGNLIETAITNEYGCYNFIEVEPGTYIVKEVMQAGWINTTLTEVTVIVEGEDVEVNFGNIECITTNARTIGYWKNWLPKFSDKDVLSLANGIKNSWDTFDSLIRTDTATNTRKDMIGILDKANAKDMSVMLKAQLLGMMLNIQAGYVDPGTYVYLGSINGASELFGGYFKKAGEIVLSIDLNWQSWDRSQQEIAKNVLDAMNNNRIFVG